MWIAQTMEVRVALRVVRGPDWEWGGGTRMEEKVMLGQ